MIQSLNHTDPISSAEGAHTASGYQTADTEHVHSHGKS